MGCSSSKSTAEKEKPVFRLIFIGLDGSGKTSIYWRLTKGEFANPEPTTGFETYTITHKNNQYEVVDASGRTRIRPIWRHYLATCDGIIFVVDSCDRARLEEAKTELLKILQDDSYRASSFLIFANKQDGANPLPVNELVEVLGLRSIDPKINWYIQACTAKNGEGITDGLDWVTDEIKKRGPLPK